MGEGGDNLGHVSFPGSFLQSIHIEIKSKKMTGKVFDMLT